MLETSQADLDQAWRDREEESKSLTSAGFTSMAIALRVYALEIRLKWIVCQHLGLDFLPKACKTHDLSELLIFTGLWKDLDDPTRSHLRSNWDLLAEFSKKRLNEIRYLPKAAISAEDLAELTFALDAPMEGVLAWLSSRP